MKQVDFIIVGLGIAGITACERLDELGRSFVVFDPGVMNATGTAGGVVNPVVLKRFTPAWRAPEFIEVAKPFYRRLNDTLKGRFLDNKPLYRIFANAQEQNDWMVASDSPVLVPFLSAEVVTNRYPNVQAPFGYGEVHNSFHIDTVSMIRAYRDYLLSSGRLMSEKFDFEKLQTSSGEHHYGDHLAKYIIFSEGSSVIDNPKFTYGCLIPKKGEYLVIRSKDLKCDAILKGPFFMIPLGDDLYQVGATFAHGDFSRDSTEQGKAMLEKAVMKMIICDFEIVDQTYGMRPTIKDRRPILGSIKGDGVFFFNGLGTRGLLMAPLLSKWLIDHIDNDVDLPSEVDIKRFES
ncbi:MAG: FAD-binding oxidoreductase [Bacteroidia bacterium]|nr:FAD-binding oxidoreductase [Bacteroidia bacterium]